MPFVIGPKLLEGNVTTVPQDMVYRNTRVTGIHPFRGGRLISTIILCRQERHDYARALLSLVETAASASSIANDIPGYSKLTNTLLEGIDSLFQVGGTEPLVGHREEFDHDLGSPPTPSYLALFDGDVPGNTDNLWVKEDKLYFGSSPETMKPFRDFSYILYSLRASSLNSDLAGYSFAASSKRIVELSASSDGKDWKIKKAEMINLYKELLSSNDVILRQTQVITGI